MAFRRVRVDDAVGLVLGHDLTKISSEYKGPAFKKGHIIKPEDIPFLKDIGKEHIYLVELSDDQVHEDEAARRMARAVASDNVIFGQPKEGRVNITAAVSGLLKIDEAAVLAINRVEHAVFSTLHTNRVVKAGDLLAAVKVVPLVVPEKTVTSVEELAMNTKGIVAVHPLRQLRIGVIITGNEVYYGRIQDKFAPVFSEKVNCFGATLIGTCFLPDDSARIADAIKNYVHQGADVVIAAGGMSVDPDDVTPEAIRSTGAEIVSYGTPVLPGAMFMLAYLGEVAVMGCPACGMYSRTTVFDLIFPRVLAGERLSKADIAAMGYGGLCTACPTCSFPHCPFGK